MPTLYNCIVLIWVASLVGIGLRAGWEVKPAIDALILAIFRDVWRGLRYLRRRLI